MDFQTKDIRSQAKASINSQNEQALLWELIEKTILAHASDLARSGRFADAEASITSVMRNRKSSAVILDLLARIHSQQGHWEEAREAWTQALQINPENKTYAAGLECITQMQKRRKFPRVFILAIGLLLIFLCGLFSRRFTVLPLPLGQIKFPLDTITLTSTQKPSPSPTSTLEFLPSASPVNTPALLPSMTQTISSTPTLSTCQISSGIRNGKLNVRSGPGTGYPVIGLLSEGERVTILRTSNNQSSSGWTSITREPDLSGWINSSYCY